ncbi:hypothetical protein ABVL1U2_460101 [Acinetobacter baumannii]|nr:hypothetical protein ABVL1U2_460101 [Acinetobacter baumannii]
MQLICSLFPRQWYDTRHESFDSYTPRSQFKKYTVKHVCFSTLSA